MRRSSVFSILCVLALSLGACRPKPPPAEPEIPADEVPLETEEPEVLEGVTYEGTLAPAGISIYMEGSHRLIMDDGEFLLLESENVDLNGYVGETVSVTGDVRSTVEAGGLIMDVTDIALSKVESSASVSSSSQARSAPSSAAASSGLSSRTPPSSTPSSTVPSPASVASSAPPGNAGQTSAQTLAMAKDDLSGEQWSQQYCSPHIGFCIPVHRNWWFKSFGATTSYLWHLEVSPEELQDLGDGPLVVNLVTGNLPASDDETFKGQGDFVVGLKTWTENRHFEITAPQELRSAVEYITKNLTAQETQ